jgi:hypothetical protein
MFRSWKAIFMVWSLAILMANGFSMARIKFTGLISEIRGQLNDTIIQGWKSGIFSVKKMMTSVNNPNSPRQDAMRAVMSAYSKQWTDVLDVAQRALWEAYALTAPGAYPSTPGVRQIIPTNGGKMSGINAYCMTNALLISAGMTGVDTPPLSITPPDKPTVVAATCAAGTLTVTWVEPINKEALAYCRVWIASASGKFHRQKVKIEDCTEETVDITTIRGALGKDILLTALVGELVYLQMDTVNPSGGKSAGSNTAEVVIA